MFSYLLPSRVEGELLLSLTDCSKISDSLCQAQTVLSHASVKYLSKSMCKKLTAVVLSKHENINVPLFRMTKQITRI